MVDNYSPRRLVMALSIAAHWTNNGKSINGGLLQRGGRR